MEPIELVDGAIEMILNEDGTKYDPPKNPLTEKWEKLYPSCKGGSGYKCLYCGKCPYGEHWHVPEEDRDVWDSYMKVLYDYDLEHGNLDILKGEQNG